MKIIVLLLLFIASCQTFEKEDISHMWWLDNSAECICDPGLGYYCGCEKEN